MQAARIALGGAEISGETQLGRGKIGLEPAVMRSVDLDKGDQG
jgi:hypothetical protein